MTAFIAEELKDDLKIKWNRIKDELVKKGMDACLLTVDVNLYYTTGRVFVTLIIDKVCENISADDNCSPCCCGVLDREAKWKKSYMWMK